MKQKDYIKIAQEWVNQPQQVNFSSVKSVATMAVAEYLAQQDGTTIFVKEKKK